MRLGYILPQFAALILLLCVWLPSAQANQRLLDRVNAICDVYREKATTQLRTVGYRILHREVFHHTKLLDLVRQSDVANLDEVTTFIATTAEAGAQIQAFVKAESKRAACDIRTLRLETIRKVKLLLDEVLNNDHLTEAQDTQIEAVRQELARFPSVFENAMTKVRAVLAEAGPFFTKEHDTASAGILKLNKEAIADNGAHTKEFAKKFLLNQERAIDEFEDRLKAGGQRILRIWSQYAAQTFESKSFAWSLRNVDD